MILGIGSDPNAQKAKEHIMEYIKNNWNCEIIDFGSDDVIYANVAIELATSVAKGDCDKGILICGTGIGMSIAANKVKGAYAGLVYDVYSAQRAVLSNNCNIICFGAFTQGEKTMEMMVKEFLDNKFVQGCSSQKKVDAYVKYDCERK